MIVGDPSVFALESGITYAYERLSFIALGFFLIHIGGRRCGVNEPDATMLANSFGEVEDRIARRGRHVAPFALELDAGKIADAFCSGVYADEHHDSYFGISWSEFRDLFYSNHLMWAPDGDAAFDDGSFVLHFDVGDRVRLIGFKFSADYRYVPDTLSDQWLGADEFYEVLRQWHAAFEAEWRARPKTSESAQV